MVRAEKMAGCSVGLNAISRMLLQFWNGSSSCNDGALPSKALESAASRVATARRHATRMRHLQTPSHVIVVVGEAREEGMFANLALPYYGVVTFSTRAVAPSKFQAFQVPRSFPPAVVRPPADVAFSRDISPPQVLTSLTTKSTRITQQLLHRAVITNSN